jgi:signal-transduction protein with cAMP-binding, CBS, and nucleotidyltransferase domain
MGKTAGFLIKTDLFDPLTEPRLAIGEGLRVEKPFREGEPVFPETSHEKELYLILRGPMEIFRTQKSHGTAVLHPTAWQDERLI